MMIAETGERSYWYRTDHLYPLGTRLRITGYVTDESLGLRRQLDEPLTFQPVSGEMDRAGWLRMRGLHGTISPSNVIVQGQDDLPRYTRTKARLIDHVNNLFQ
ncbi:MAG: hypothetical protein H6766_05910 [Candidatus Peribacteria bacterium]|nr:MAG: hypothetical protein H6766_05910 [Candidatus Peribacteria bacterium]